MPKRGLLEVSSPNISGGSAKKHRLVLSEPDLISPGKEKIISSDHLRETKNVSIAGTIKSITLKNFMCHDNFTVNNISDSINFVIGKNGSGKSALLTALVVGLGGRAFATNRASSVKSLVKTGKQQAIIEIVLSNDGLKAYQNERFGKEIVIERKIFINGTSTYRILNEKREVISKKRDDLLKIAKTLKIMVENPLVVLNQDASRNYLHSSQPSDRYKIFHKASLLESIEENYRDADAFINSTIHLAKTKETNFNIFGEKVEVAKVKHEAIKSINDLELKLHEMEKELSWSLIKTKSQEANPLHKELEKQDAMIKKLKEKNLEAKKKMEDAVKSRNKLMKEIEEDSQNLNKLSSRRNDLRLKLQEKEKCLKDAEKSFRVSERAQKEAKITFVAFNNQKKKMLKNNERNFDDERRQRHERIMQLESDKVALEDKLKVKHNDCEQFGASKEMFRSRYNDKLMEENANSADITSFKNRLDEMRSSGNNITDRFGRNMHSLCIDIENLFSKKKFLKKPIGPIGAFITLPNMNHGLAVENCLGGLLHSFLCDNSNDMKLLQSLLKKYGLHSTIITSKFHNTMHDIKSKQPQCKYPTILDVIECKEIAILNSLIDNKSIESTILLPTNTEARSYMIHADRTVKVGFSCESGDQIFPSPNYRYYANHNRNVKYLVSDTSVLIKQLENELQRKVENINVIKSERINLENEYKKQNKIFDNSQKDAQQTESQLKKCERELNSLRLVIDPEPQNFDEIEEVLKEAGNKLEMCIKEVNSKMKTVDDVKKEVFTIEKQYKDLDEELNGKSQSSNERLLQKLSNDYETAESNIGKIETVTMKCTTNIDQIKSDLLKLDVDLEAMKTRTKNVYGDNEVSSPRKTEVIKENIDRLTKKIDLIQEKNGNAEDVAAEYSRLENLRQLIEKELNSLQKLLKFLKNGMDKRKTLYKLAQEQASSLCKTAFLLNSRKRHKNPFIYIDHEIKTIDIKIDDKNLKSMSGGERSFMTVCFVLALWEIISSPFRCMDEFDVFMDMVNRKVSLKMLIDARSAKKCQYIFLTPLDVAEIIPENISPKIFEVKPPGRYDKENMK